MAAGKSKNMQSSLSNVKQFIYRHLLKPLNYSLESDPKTSSRQVVLKLVTVFRGNGADLDEPVVHVLMMPQPLKGRATISSGTAAHTSPTNSRTSSRDGFSRLPSGRGMARWCTGPDRWQGAGRGSAHRVVNGNYRKMGRGGERGGGDIHM